MDVVVTITSTILEQFQKPTLAFLIAGMMLAALGSKFEVPLPVYKFIVIVLLLKVGMGAGIAIRDADVMSLLVPAIGAALIGMVIVFLGGKTLAKMRRVSELDALATVGMFGAVSASTLAAGMAVLDDEGIAYEGYIGALYPFMDIAALVTAIVLAKLKLARSTAATLPMDGSGVVALGGARSEASAKIPDGTGKLVQDILIDTFRSPAISALLAGLCLGVFARPDTVFQSFYEPLFRGLLSILMLIMGMEAWARFAELRKVAHAYILYGLTAPIVHGLIGFGFGMIAHHLTGFSEGGIVLLAVMAASSSDISGP
ncbi:MAG: sodium-dependent bicarbonate transport family permease, partial [Pseudomonadota bacterium]